MKYTKVEEIKGEYLLIYFVDKENLKQGELLCYKTEGKLPSTENLLYTEEYKNGEFITKNWMKLPEPVLV
jgi:hypothetical protein